MKKLLRSILFLSVFIISGIFAVNVFATNIVDLSPITIGETSVNFNLILKDSNATDAGILISKTKEGISNSPTCENLVTHSEDYLVAGNNYLKTVNNLEADTVYYYTPCILYNTDIYVIDEISSLKTKLITNENAVTTLPTYKMTDGSYQISLQILAESITSSGFKISEANKTTLPSCNYEFNGLHIVEGKKNKTLSNLNAGTYTYQACAKNTSGVEFLGSKKTFTVDSLSNNEIIAQCKIDYVEFLPKNSTNLSPESSEYKTFVIYRGKEISINIKPYETSKCSNVNIDEIWVKDIDTNRIALSVIGGGGKFSEDGTYSVKVIAGDNTGCKNNVCRYAISVKYGIEKIGSGWFEKIFTTNENYQSSNEIPSTEQKRKKGVLEYEKKDGKTIWKNWQSSNPTYEQVKQYSEISGPCFDDLSGEYKKGCYELLAPIPGLENSPGVSSKDGRVYIDDIKTYQLGNYINILFQIALSILGVISVVMIVVAGVQYMTVESIYGKTDAKQKIIGAVTGLILALSIYLIINTINPEILKINLTSGITSVKITSDFESGDGFYPSGRYTNVNPGTKTKTCPEGITYVGGIGVCKTISDKIELLLSDSRAAGVKLGGWGARTYDRQVELRKKNCTKPNFDIYEGNSRECTPPTARPGYSRHESGLAIDFTCNGAVIKTENDCFNWLKQNAEKYGLYNFKKEKWHWSTDGN